MFQPRKIYEASNENSFSFVNSSNVSNPPPQTVIYTTSPPNTPPGFRTLYVPIQTPEREILIQDETTKPRRFYSSIDKVEPIKEEPETRITKIRKHLSVKNAVMALCFVLIFIALISGIRFAYKRFFASPVIQESSLNSGVDGNCCTATTNLSVVRIRLARLETPLPMTASGIATDHPLLIYRPYVDSGDYYGTFSVSSEVSAALNVSAKNEYFEVVVYRYPEWDVVYAETNVSEVFFDFLAPGTYATLVFSTDTIDGEMTLCPNLGRSRPYDRFHRKSSADDALEREAVSEKIILDRVRGGREISRINSSTVFVWPGTVFSRVEKLFFPVPSQTTDIYITIPSYGLVIEGGREYFGSLIHEGDNMCIYRAVAKPNVIGEKFVNITVVFPNIDPDSEVPTSPALMARLYG